MAKRPRSPNRKECRFASLYVRLGNGAEAVRRAGYARSEPKDYGSKLLLKPHVLILVLRLEERRRLRRRPVATDAGRRPRGLSGRLRDRPHAGSVRHHPGARRWPISADGARPKTISYLQRHGFGNLRAAAKGAGSVEEGVAFLQNHDILVHPRCRHLIDELGLYSYRTDPHTGELRRRLDDRENHVIDALRYAVESRRHSTYDASMRWV